MEEVLRKIDELIREARIQEARREVAQFRLAKVPRTYALSLARSARTVGLPEISIRILNPIIRPSVRSNLKATDEEKAVYAAVLTRIGASNEALEILRKLDSKKVPECLLYETYALVSQWNYRDTIPLLKEYLESRKLDLNQRLIGEVNLVAAYVHERRKKEADTLLSQLRDTTKENHLMKLYGNTLELSAQHAIFDRKWSEAKEFLDEAQRVLEESTGLDVFFVQKWRAIADLLKDPKNTKPIHQVKDIGIKLKHWETVRDCDKFKCIATKNEELYHLLYFGTPHKDFRERLTEDYGKEVELPESFVWYPDRSANKKGSPIPLPTLKRGQVLERLLGTLTSDFYRPIRLAAIYSELYPNEYFNPKSAPDKIHQAMKRLRQELNKNKIPLSIKEESGSYAMIAEKPVGIEVRLDHAKNDRRESLLKDLKKMFPEKSFSVNDAAQILQISPRSAVRLCLEGMNRGLLVREGKASLTKYHF